MKNDMTHLDDLVYSILYVTSQGGCDGVRKVRDPEGFCDILGRSRKGPCEKNNLHTLTESALYNPVDDPEVFAGFGFVLIYRELLSLDGWGTDGVTVSGQCRVPRIPPPRAVMTVTGHHTVAPLTVLFDLPFVELSAILYAAIIIISGLSVFISKSSVGFWASGSHTQRLVRLIPSPSPSPNVCCCEQADFDVSRNR